jgi:hypothetical protein
MTRPARVAALIRYRCTVYAQESGQISCNSDTSQTLHISLFTKIFKVEILLTWRYVKVKIALEIFSHTGCIMKTLWCYNFLIFYPILINDTSNEIVLETLYVDMIYFFFNIIFFDRA